jgi:tRNA (guanosine-2'-O-)-methyltransferase
MQNPSSSASLTIQLVNHLSQFVLEKRLAHLHYVLSNRTRYLTIVLEDIFQPQNASAVLRSCDCFGIQDVHIIENTNQFNVSPKVALGAAKWLNLKKYKKYENNTIEAISQLRNQGYRIVATSPHTFVTSLDNFNLEKGKVALFFGTELTGLSKDVLDNADEYMLIPTFGFTESLNISVSAAICLHQLSNNLRNSSIQYELTEVEYQETMLDWLRKSVKSWKSIEKRFLSQVK